MIFTLSIVLASYLLGAVPFGLVITRLAGLGDIREIGSGNIGATNVLRTGRKDLALLTLLLDSGKGAIAVVAASYLVGDFNPVFLDNTTLPVACGAAAFLGHCFPIWLGFKGGKGVATFFGTLIAISPVLALIAGATWAGMALIFRMSSLSGLSAALVAPFAAYYMMGVAIVPYLALMTLLVFYRHLENIKRLITGTEPKIGSSKK